MGPPMTLSYSHSHTPPHGRLRLALLTSASPRCGIAAYSDRLVEALRPHVEVDVVPVSLPFDESLSRLNAADLVHIQHEYSFWGSALPGKSRFPDLLSHLDRPWVVTAHTVAPAEEVLGLVSTVGWRAVAKRLGLHALGLRRFVEVLPFLGARATLVHTGAASETLHRRGVSHVRHLPMPVPQLAVPADPAAVLARLGLTGQPFIVLPGFLTPSKGGADAVRAFAAQDYPGRLVLAGGARDEAGEAYEQQLRQLIAEMRLEDRVRITGYLPEAELGTLLRLADLVLLPYRTGTGSYAAATAIGCGAAVLAADLPCFEDFPCLALYQRGQLAITLGRLLQSETDRAALRVAAARYAERHSWNHVAEQHLEIYQRALADLVPASSVHPS